MNPNDTGYTYHRSTDVLRSRETTETALPYHPTQENSIGTKISLTQGIRQMMNRKHYDSCQSNENDHTPRKPQRCSSCCIMM